MRAATRSDVPTIRALIAACEIANDGAAEVHSSDVEQSFALAGNGGLVVVEAPDQLIGWATIAGDRADADVHPAWRGRGVGAALLAWTERQAREAGVTRLQQIVTNADANANHLLEGAGYRIHHTSWILRMEMGETPPTVAIPAGITVRPYRPEDAAATYRLIEAAFNEWPDRQPTVFADWSAHVIDHAAFSPGLSRLAFDGEELVGAALTDDYPGQDEGWVQQVATKASHRRRGIARALLQSVFVAFHATGRRLVGLSTGSHMGALEPYERIGMQIRRSYTAWQKDLRVGEPSAGSGGAR